MAASSAWEKSITSATCRRPAYPQRARCSPRSNSAPPVRCVECTFELERHLELLCSTGCIGATYCRFYA